jgi:Raf kinase inhibitor-like YbhB/YbcL family protein
METQVTSILITSDAFTQQGFIPSRYTCEGENINPPLEISNLPEQTKSLALIMEDPDATRGTFDHWIAWNIKPDEPITEGNVPGVNGTNSFGKKGYGGPCPPTGRHRYYIKVYALDTTLDLPVSSGKKELQAAIKDHVLGHGELMGHYEKKQKQ